MLNYLAFTYKKLAWGLIGPPALSEKSGGGGMLLLEREDHESTASCSSLHAWHEAGAQ